MPKWIYEVVELDLGDPAELAEQLNATEPESELVSVALTPASELVAFFRRPEPPEGPEDQLVRYPAG